MATALGQPLGSSSFCSLCLIGTDGDTLLPLLLSHHNLSVVNMEKWSLPKNLPACVGFLFHESLFEISPQPSGFVSLT